VGTGLSWNFAPMFIENRDNHDWSSYDFVIVGAGFAGLFLAEQLGGEKKVLVVEVGGKNDPLNLGKGDYEIEATGHYIERLGQRSTGFGGSADLWGGQTAPFSPQIFDNRGDIAGWPIFYQDYAVHLPEARKWLELAASQNLHSPISFEQGIFEGYEGLCSVRFDFPTHPTAGSGAAAIEKFAGMKNVDVLLRAKASDIVLNSDGTGVELLEITDQRTGAVRRLPTGCLLLCAGGIENARLLLWSGRKYAATNPLVGGPNELTGKYFMEHPVIWPLELFLDSRADISSTIRNTIAGEDTKAMWTVTEEISRRHGLLRFGASCFDLGAPPREDHNLNESDCYFLTRAPRYKNVQVSFQLEQSPHPGSFVALSSQLDRHGRPLARVHWEVSQSDLANYRKCVTVFGGLLSQSGHVRTRLRDAYRGENWDQIEFGRCGHHMGTTRMAHSRLRGVVDTDCRVFGLANLYIAGCSVFPNGDFVNPTANMLALAARLAHKLHEEVSNTGTVVRFEKKLHSPGLLISGWSEAEEQGTWSDGPRSEIELDVPGARQLRIVGRHYALAMVELKANGIIVYSGSVRSLCMQTVALDGNDRQKLVFEFDNLTSPKEAGENDDTRRLGLFISAMEIQ
jgi:choline dehydrogenase-like flavoprotein